MKKRPGSSAAFKTIWEFTPCTRTLIDNMMFPSIAPVHRFSNSELYAYRCRSTQLILAC